MTIAEFFMILPHGPNWQMGLGAFKDRVRLLTRVEVVSEPHENKDRHERDE